MHSKAAYPLFLAGKEHMTKYTTEQIVYAEQQKVHKLRALQAIHTELVRMSKNYFPDSVEQEVFSRMLNYANVVYNIYTES